MSENIYKHYNVMMKQVFRTLAMIFGFAAGYAIWQDLTNTFTANAPLGQLWYSNNPGSLQFAETIVSRYIDPCSLITALNCSPFLWHPFFSTILRWPAALVLLGVCVMFYWLSFRFRGFGSGSKASSKTLKRHGAK